MLPIPEYGYLAIHQRSIRVLLLDDTRNTQTVLHESFLNGVDLESLTQTLNKLSYFLPEHLRIMATITRVDTNND